MPAPGRSSVLGVRTFAVDFFFRFGRRHFFRRASLLFRLFTGVLPGFLTLLFEELLGLESNSVAAESGVGVCCDTSALTRHLLRPTNHRQFWVCMKGFKAKIFHEYVLIPAGNVQQLVLFALQRSTQQPDTNDHTSTTNNEYLSMQAACVTNLICNILAVAR